jgi:hypothetical protein
VYARLTTPTYAACPEHEVGPIAAHLRGPVAALPPEGHPDHFLLDGDSLRRPSVVNGLIHQACGPATAERGIRCTCDGRSGHPLHVSLRHVSQGRVVRAHPNSPDWQENVETAYRSQDIDLLSWTVEPRIEAVKHLCDRVRVEHGGTMPDSAVESAAVLLRTLAGPRRWSVRRGHLAFDGWPANMRYTANAESCDHIAVQDPIHDALLRRLIEG